MTAPTLLDRFRGCLLAGACGDALGLPIEFMSLAEIKAQYGERGLTDFAPAYGRIGSVSDDSQLTIWTAEGLLRFAAQRKTHGQHSVEACVNHSYLRWLLTQGCQPQCKVGQDGWLYRVPELHVRRAPGATCIAALSSKTSIDDLYASNNSKGCGGVMRSAPVGLMFDSLQYTFDVAGNLARLTHGHPVSTAASGVMAALVRLLVNGKDLPEALAVAKSLLDTQADGVQAVMDALTHAEGLAGSPVASADAIARLGRGWVAEEALAIAVYACLRAQTLEEALILAVNHSGDSDSTGAIAGNLMGAWRGVDAIPRRWLERLELRDAIEAVADDLHHGANGELSLCGGTPESERFLARYPGR
jgi:ADP-ribosylglycohydrolase